jgi:hypothetical protein
VSNGGRGMGVGVGGNWETPVRGILSAASLRAESKDVGAGLLQDGPLVPGSPISSLQPTRSSRSCPSTPFRFLRQAQDRLTSLHCAQDAWIGAFPQHPTPNPQTRKGKGLHLAEEALPFKRSCESYCGFHMLFTLAAAQQLVTVMAVVPTVWPSPTLLPIFMNWTWPSQKA